MLYGVAIAETGGSCFEFANYKCKDFELLPESVSGLNQEMWVARTGKGKINWNTRFATDDTIHTLAVAQALWRYKTTPWATKEDLLRWTAENLHDFGNAYYHAGYGRMMYEWFNLQREQAIQKAIAGNNISIGNGAAMRVSPVAWVANDLEEVKQLSRIVTYPTHNSDEGRLMAEAAAVATFLARKGKSKAEIKSYIANNYYEELKDPNFTVANLRRGYRPVSPYVTCVQYKDVTDGKLKTKPADLTVPMAIQAFLESENYEDAVKTAISIGGDSDTIGAICGGIAEAAYGVPQELKARMRGYLDDKLRKVLDDFEKTFQDKEWEKRVAGQPMQAPISMTNKPDPTAEKGEWILNFWDELQRQHSQQIKQNPALKDRVTTFKCMASPGYDHTGVKFVATPIKDSGGQVAGWLYNALDADVSHTFIWLKEFENRLFYEMNGIKNYSYFGSEYARYDMTYERCWAAQNNVIQVFGPQQNSRFPSKITTRDGEFQHTGYYTPNGQIRQKQMSIKVDKHYAIQAIYQPGSNRVNCFQRVRLRTTPPEITTLTLPESEYSVANLSATLTQLKNRYLNPSQKPQPKPQNMQKQNPQPIPQNLQKQLQQNPQLNKLVKNPLQHLDYLLGIQAQLQPNVYPIQRQPVQQVQYKLQVQHTCPTNRTSQHTRSYRSSSIHSRTCTSRTHINRHTKSWAMGLELTCKVSPMHLTLAL